MTFWPKTFNTSLAMRGTELSCDTQYIRSLTMRAEFRDGAAAVIGILAGGAQMETVKN